MTVGELAKLLYEITYKHEQWHNLVYHYSQTYSLYEPVWGTLHEDWDEIHAVAEANNIDWHSVLEVTIFLHLEENIKRGVYLR